jgi:hypothetical protein
MVLDDVELLVNAPDTGMVHDLSTAACQRGTGLDGSGGEGVSARCWVLREHAQCCLWSRTIRGFQTARSLIG